MKLPNIDLGKTQITDKIRVSSAAIYYDGMWFGNYYQLETWIFSDDKERQESHQIIHGTCGNNIPEKLIAKTKKVHDYISNNLKIKFHLIIKH
jgi:hypothetical protein